MSLTVIIAGDGAERATDLTEVVPVQATSVTTEDGRTWTRLPEPWVDRAGWCGAEQRYGGKAVTYTLACRNQAVWTDGREGRCSVHMQQLVTL